MINRFSLPRSPWLLTWLDISILVALWCACVTMVHPWGDFPLNDDWSFALSVKHYIETGELRPTGWAAMTLVSNLLWGELFTRPFGASFNSLRLSSLFAGAIGAVTMYLLCRTVHARRLVAWVSGATLALTPVYFALSHTFMTDVFFCTLLLLSVLCFVKFLQSQQWWAWGAGTLLVLMATMSRQVALAVPLAFAVAQLGRGGVRGLSIPKAVVPLLLCAGAWQWFQVAMKERGWLPPIFAQTQQLLFDALERPDVLLILFENTWKALANMALFMAPAVVLLLLTRSGGVRPSRQTHLVTWIIWVLGLVALASMNGAQSLMLPNLGNILDLSGIGPFTLHDMYIEGRERHVPPVPHGYWWLLTGFVLLLVPVLLTHFMHGLAGLWRQCRGGSLWREPWDDAAAVVRFIALVALGSLFPVLLSAMYDRYLLPIAALALVACVAATSAPDQAGASAAAGGRLLWQRSRAGLAMACLAVMGVFSVVTVHDYLAWNRARWELLNHLTQDLQISPALIDGGLEFNGLHFYDPAYLPRAGKSWWWVQDDALRVTFGEEPGYVPFKMATYPRWLTGRQEPVLVLRRVQPTSPSSSP